MRLNMYSSSDAECYWTVGCLVRRESRAGRCKFGHDWCFNGQIGPGHLGSKCGQSREVGGLSSGIPAIYRCRRGRRGTWKGDWEGTASEIGREIREQCSGGREGRCSNEDGVSNCFGSSDHPWYYCLHSWYHWFKKMLLSYAKLAYVWTCAHLLSLLSHWSVYPSGTTQPLKLSYLTKQALCDSTPITFSFFTKISWLF